MIVLAGMLLTMVSLALANTGGPDFKVKVAHLLTGTKKT